MRVCMISRVIKINRCTISMRYDLKRGILTCNDNRGGCYGDKKLSKGLKN